MSNNESQFINLVQINAWQLGRATTNPSKVAEYAHSLNQEAMKAEVRGVLVFEDRGEGIRVVEVGSCSPASSRMMIGMLKWLVRKLLA